MKKATIIGSAIAVFASPLNAAEWTLDIQADPTFGYDDNVFLEEDEQGSFKYSIAPTLVLGREIENSSSFLSLGYSIERFSSISTLDAENPFLRFDTSYSLERLQLGLSASYVEDNARNDAEENTGDFSSDATSRSRTLAPSLSYQLTEIDTLTSNFNYSERKYSTTGENDDGFEDNETKSVTIGWNRQFTERFTGGLNTTVANYQTDGLTFSTDDDSYNVSTYLGYQLSEVWLVDANVGFRRLSTERTANTGMVTKDNSTGSTFDVSTTYDKELDSVSLRYTKALLPTSDGDVNDQERISVTWAHELSEVLTASIAASYQESESASDETDDEKRQNINFSPSLRWQVDAKLGLSLGYAYQQQKLTDAKDVDSNAVTMTLTYDWDGYRVSR